MDEREHDYLRQQIRQLERSKRRWQLATLTLVAALVMFVIVGAIASLPVVQWQRESIMHLERAYAAEAAARVKAEEAARQLSQMKREANEATKQSPKEEATKRGRTVNPEGDKAGKGEIGQKD